MNFKYVLFSILVMAGCGKSSKNHDSDQKKPEQQTFAQILKPEFHQAAKDQLNRSLAAPADEWSAKTKVYRSLFNQNSLIDALLLTQDIRSSLVEFHMDRFRAGRVDSAGGEFAFMNFYLALKAVKEISPGKQGYKAAYEAVLEKNTKGSVAYNVAKTNMFDVIADSELQCSSGSLLFYATYMAQKDAVFIFTKGHIMPGYVLTEGRDRLVGYETTASGDALVDFGWVDELNQPLRIIRTHYFAFSKVFSDDLSNAVDVARRGLEETARSYNIPLEHLEKLVDSPLREVANSGPLNTSIYAFGSANTPPGSTPRKSRDTIDPNQYREHGADFQVALLPHVREQNMFDDADNQKQREEETPPLAALLTKLNQQDEFWYRLDSHDFKTFLQPASFKIDMQTYVVDWAKLKNENDGIEKTIDRFYFMFEFYSFGKENQKRVSEVVRSSAVKIKPLQIFDPELAAQIRTNKRFYAPLVLKAAARSGLELDELRLSSDPDYFQSNVRWLIQDLVAFHFYTSNTKNIWVVNPKTMHGAGYPDDPLAAMFDFSASGLPADSNLSSEKFKLLLDQIFKYKLVLIPEE